MNEMTEIPNYMIPFTIIGIVSACVIVVFFYRVYYYDETRHRFY